MHIRAQTMSNRLICFIEEDVIWLVVSEAKVVNKYYAFFSKKIILIFEFLPLND